MSQRYTASCAAQAIARIRRRQDAMIAEYNKLLDTEGREAARRACRIAEESFDLDIVLNELAIMRRQLDAVRKAAGKADDVREMIESPEPSRV